MKFLSRLNLKTIDGLRTAEALPRGKVGSRKYQLSPEGTRSSRPTIATEWE